MTVSLKHNFVSAVADGADTSVVRPSNWNDEHALTLATSRLLGRTTAGTGAAEEISAGTGLSLSAGTLTNSGVTSNVAGTGISVSGATGAVTVTNTGVTSIVAGTNITISGSTGAVTVNASSSAPTTAQVLSATTGISVSSVGSWSFLSSNSGSGTYGNTTAGSNLSNQAGSTQSGTWRNFGTVGAPCAGWFGMFLRIA